jgi:hypothetical protein
MAQAEAVRSNAATLHSRIDAKFSMAKAELVEKHPDRAAQIEALAQKCHQEAILLRGFEKKRGTRKLLSIVEKTKRQFDELVKSLIRDNHSALGKRVLDVKTEYQVSSSSTANTSKEVGQ